MLSLDILEINRPLRSRRQVRKEEELLWPPDRQRSQRLYPTSGSHRVTFSSLAGYVESLWNVDENEQCCGKPQINLPAGQSYFLDQVFSDQEKNKSYLCALCDFAVQIWLRLRCLSNCLSKRDIFEDFGENYSFSIMKGSGNFTLFPPWIKIS